MALIDMIKGHLANTPTPAAESDALAAKQMQDRAMSSGLESMGALSGGYRSGYPPESAFEETVAMDANDFLAAVEGTMEARLENHYGRTMRPATVHEAVYYALESTIPEGLVPPEPTFECECEACDDALSGVQALLEYDPDQPNPEDDIENSTTIGDLSNAPQDIAEEGFGEFLQKLNMRIPRHARIEATQWAKDRMPKYKTVEEMAEAMKVGNGFKSFNSDTSFHGLLTSKNNLCFNITNAEQGTVEGIKHAIKALDKLVAAAVDDSLKTGTWDEEEGKKHTRGELFKLYTVETLCIYFNVAKTGGPHVLEAYLNDGNTFGGHVIVVEAGMDNSGNVTVHSVSIEG